MDLTILDKVSFPSPILHETSVGCKNPRLLISRELTGAFQKGDLLDANATAILIEEISGSGTHGDVRKYCDEQIKKLKAEMAQPNGFATLDSTGNVPLSQLGNIDTSIYKVVTTLPATGEDSKIYLIKDPDAPDDENIYFEWAYINSAWEKIGEVHEDLTGYLKKTQSADDVNKGAILKGGALADPIAKGVAFKAPLIYGSTLIDNTPVLDIAANTTLTTSDPSVSVDTLFLAPTAVSVWKYGYYVYGDDFADAAHLTVNELSIAGGDAYFRPTVLHSSEGGELKFNNNHFYILGYDNTGDATNSTIIGVGNNIATSEDGNFIAGYKNITKVSVSRSSVIGVENTTTGVCLDVLGCGNTVTGTDVTLVGTENTV